MTPTLVAIAGRSRVGKGTCATHFSEWAAQAGFTSFERQLSDNGKWHLARIFFPEISRVEAVQWFEKLKGIPNVNLVLNSKSPSGPLVHGMQPLQKFIQHGLQEGGRDIFGEHFWTNMILPINQKWHGQEFWVRGFFDAEALKSVAGGPTDLALISDLRQPNEGQRVKQCKGLLIEIHRPDVDDGYVTGKGHITEQGLPPELVDHHLHSTGDLGYFETICRELFDNEVLPRLKENA